MELTASMSKMKNKMAASFKPLAPTRAASEHWTMDSLTAGLPTSNPSLSKAEIVIQIWIHGSTITHVSLRQEYTNSSTALKIGFNNSYFV
jgi:hypothetical protein